MMCPKCGTELIEAFSNKNESTYICHECGKVFKLEPVVKEEKSKLRIVK